MEVTITGRHIDLNDDIKNIITEKAQKLKKYDKRTKFAEIVVEQVKYRYLVEILVSADHYKLQAQAENDDLLTCIDEMMSKIDRQMRRHKEKYHNKKHLRKSSPFDEMSDEDEEE